MSLVEVFEQQVIGQPNSIALEQLDPAGEKRSQYTWLQLSRLVAACRAGLQAVLLTSIPKCPQPSIHVATWLPNGVNWIVVDLALQSLGWVHVALDRRLPVNQLNRLVQHSQAALLICEEATVGIECDCPIELVDQFLGFGDQGPRVERALVGDDQPAQLLYTSGTISQPKGVVLSHGNLLSNAVAKLGAAAQSRDDVRLNILPFAHAYARTCELSTWIVSGSQLCLAPDWSSLLRWAATIRPTLLNLVPHLAQKLASLLNSEQTPPAQLLGDRLRLLQVGGAALPEKVWNTLAEAGWPPLQGYGLTETSPVVCSNIAGRQRADCVGFPVAGVELRVDDSGVLWTRGPHVMVGYWQDAAATRQRIVDGWLNTGDLAQIHSDGSVSIRGRADDQIMLSTGYNVSPFEISQLLADDPWVESLVIVGQAKSYLGALVCPCWQNLDEEWRHNPALAECLVERWRTRLNVLPSWMQIRRVIVLPEPLTIENGGLNFKGAVRRKFVEDVLHADLVDALYAVQGEARPQKVLRKS